MDKKYAFILSFLLTALIASTIYAFSISNNAVSEVFVARVIDGDTLELSDSTIVRLININTPEKNQPGYEEAKAFLKQWENSSIFIETFGLDKYHRTLARAFSEEYINLKIVEEGYASKFLVQNLEKEDFAKAEKFAIENEKGIWKKSSHYGCFTTNINKKQEIVELINNCPIINMKGWKIKDESRKIFLFANLSLGEVNLHTFSGNNTSNEIFWNLESEVWNDDADSFYLFDKEGKLAHYESYGY